MSNARNLADGESRFVNTAGDTMTGDLIVDTNVGIGTSSPSKTLTVAAPQVANTVMEVLRVTGSGTYSSSGSNEAGAGLSFGQYSGSYPDWNLGQISGVRSGASWDGALTFSTNNGSSETSITERMRIDSAGRVTMPYQPAFLIKAPSTYTGNGTVGGTELFSYTDAVINVGGHFNTTTSTFTAPVTGMYAVNWWASAATSSLSARYIRLRLYKNGALYLNPHNTIANESGDSDYNLVGSSAIVSLSTSDTINVQWGSSAATNQITFYSDMCFFSGYLLG